MNHIPSDTSPLALARGHFGNYDKIAEAIGLCPVAFRSRIYRANRKGASLTFSRPESVLLDIRSNGSLHFMDLHPQYHEGDTKLAAFLTEIHQRELAL